jgi:hypothetical protein
MDLLVAWMLSIYTHVYFYELGQTIPKCITKNFWMASKASQATDPDCQVAWH